MVAILTLALGIGVNVTCFGVVRAVLLKPLAYRDAGRIVVSFSGATPVHYAEISSGVRELASVGAYVMEEDLAVTGNANPQVLKTNRVPAHLLEILGVTPLLGRGLNAGENAALFIYEFWQRQLAVKCK